jgi:hypothetical protein
MTVEMIALILVAGLVGAGLIGLAVVVKGRSPEVFSPEVDPMADIKTFLANREGAMDEKVSQLDTKLAALQESVTTRETALHTQFAGIGSQMKTITGLFTNDRSRRRSSHPRGLRRCHRLQIPPEPLPRGARVS